MTSSRQQLLKKWSQAALEAKGQLGDYQWQLVSGDASFRRYFRIANAQHSWICVDAPPEHENSRQFIKIAELLAQVNAPKVIAYDLAQGFMLLSDLGDQLYLPLLLKDQLLEDQLLKDQLLKDQALEDKILKNQAFTNQAQNSADALYKAAIDSLIQMQQIDSEGLLPPYDAKLLNQEMELFRDWFLQKHLQLELSPAENQMLDQLFAWLTDSALEQPQVFVHRDYHSRNIMWLAEQPPGIIDFQDAVQGPVSYDLLSLLRDCYIEWPDYQVQAWVDYFIEQSDWELDKAQFMQWFDWMGLQRHIKVAGIFARLNYRDGKSGYLKDIPLTLRYIVRQAEKYPQLEEFSDWMQHKILPAMDSLKQVQ